MELVSSACDEMMTPVSKMIANLTLCLPIQVFVGISDRSQLCF